MGLPPAALEGDGEQRVSVPRSKGFLPQEHSRQGGPGRGGDSWVPGVGVRAPCWLCPPRSDMAPDSVWLEGLGFLGGSTGSRWAHGVRPGCSAASRPQTPRARGLCAAYPSHLSGGASRPPPQEPLSATGDQPLCSIPIENILAVERLEEESFKMKNVSVVSPWPAPRLHPSRTPPAPCPPASHCGAQQPGSSCPRWPGQAEPARRCFPGSLGCHGPTLGPCGFSLKLLNVIWL